MAKTGPVLTYCAEQVRRHDPDRFLTALYAPSERRDAIMTLLAFNLEIAKTRESVSEPMLGEIRLQWWREAVVGIYSGGPVRRHEVAEPLAEVVREHALSRRHIDRLIDVRAADLYDETPATVDALIDYADGTSSTLSLLSLEILGEPENEAAAAAARDVGIAWAIVGLIRAMPHHLRHGRIFLPADLQRQFGVETLDLRELRQSDAVDRAVGALADVARGKLAGARALRRDVPARARPALLHGILADGYLSRMRRAGYNIYDPRLKLRPGLLSALLAYRGFLGRY